jgi:hypothetical protein
MTMKCDFYVKEVPNLIIVLHYAGQYAGTSL